MSPAEKFVLLDAVFCMCNTVLVYFNLIHKEHRLAVREILFQFFSVHDCDCALFDFSECETTVVTAESE